MAPEPVSAENFDVKETERREIIDSLYDVAVDPSRLEELLDKWEKAIGPYRASGDRQEINSFADANIEAHFLRANVFLDRIADEGNANSVQKLVDEFDKVAAFVLDENLKIEAHNSIAKNAFKIGKLTYFDDLPFEKSEVDAAQNTIKLMFAKQSDAAEVIRIRSEKEKRFVILQLRIFKAKNGIKHILAVTSELGWPKGFEEVLEAAFKLTDAEQSVVKSLVECNSLREVAESRNRSVETIRAQLKSILAKTGTSSQAELVRLTISLMDIAARFDEAEELTSSQSRGINALETMPFQTLKLADSRRLDYLILGDPNGQPCLFLHDNYGLVRWPAPAENAAKAEGIKIIVPIRAGYGHSSPYGADKDITEGTRQDIKALLDHLGVESCPLVSMNTEAYHIMNFANHYPERVDALILCAGTLPLKNPEQYQRMDKWQRFIRAGACYTPHLLPFMVKSGFYLAKRIGKRGLLYAVYKDSPADIATFEKQDVFEAMLLGSEVALSDQFNAHKSASRNILAQETVDWQPVVQSLEGKLPIHFMCGLKSPATPEETIKEYMDEYPFMNFITYEDAGELVLFAEWRDVLDLIKSSFKS